MGRPKTEARSTDEEVHRYLNLAPEHGQVVYHFAIGYPVLDADLEA
jgi:hypothetical protein